jgi:hypothetical protein
VALYIRFILSLDRNYYYYNPQELINMHWLKKLAFIILASVLVCLVFVIFSLSISPRRATIPILSSQEQEARQFFIAASEYFHVFSSIDLLTQDRIAEAENTMRSGDIKIDEYGDRISEIFFSEATSIELIDNLPEYSILKPVMWETGEPPKLEWLPTDYTYQSDFKNQHIIALEKTRDHIRNLAKDYKTVMQYTPTWHNDPTLTPMKETP